jgi:predicted RNase H-like HicB family nuclease
VGILEQETMQKASIIVRAQWDDEAKVWVATSDDVPGLVTEAETQDALLAKLQVMIPELIDCNEELADQFIPEVPVVLMSEQMAKVRLRA